MTSNNGVTEELEQILKFLKDIVSDTGITDEELEQSINKELKQHLPPTVHPSIIDHLGIEFIQKTIPSREEYLWEGYIIIYAAKQENHHQVPVKPLKNHLMEKGLKKWHIGAICEGLNGVYFERVTGSDRCVIGEGSVYGINPAYITKNLKHTPVISSSFSKP